MPARDDNRPDPDTLLRAAEKDLAGKGKLKIFFGMAAGVGKTYAMLSEARHRGQEGTDVVIGWLELHARSETNALAEGIEQVPRAVLDYRGKALEEMDVDAVVRRAPSLVLVDELAHTNAPGSRNRKRYQDVLEMLDRGIDVFTTVNVQHLEGFADTVEEISGITVTERIPDSIFDIAHEIVLIDIPPEELRRRLTDGKVYIGERATAAMDNFFKPSTLAALREMALRHTALLVNHQRSDMLQESPRDSAAPAGEKLLVAISPSPNSAHLIRWTRQRAFTLKAEWTALFVDTGASIDDAAREALRRNMNLARQLGAAVISIPSDDVALSVIRFARANAVTEIVVGKAGLVARAPVFRPRTVTERIVRMSGDIDVDVVQETGTILSHPRRRLSSYLRPDRASLVKMVLAIAAVTGINLALLPSIGYRSASILYLFGLIGLSFFVERASVLIAALLSAVLWDFFFLPPRFTFLISKPEDILMFFLYFATAAALGYLMTRLRSNQRMLDIRSRRMALLLNLSQTLSLQKSLDGIVRVAIDAVARSLDCEVVMLVADAAGRLDPTVHARSGAPSDPTQDARAESPLDEKELAAAQWCFENRTPCGRYTDTLHMARFHYIPLVTPGAAVGVVGVTLAEGATWLQDHEDTLQGLCRTVSLSIGRELLAEENRRNLMAQESERLGRVLLNTVSHELRTPLTTIKGSITALMDRGTGDDPEARSALLAETLTAADRLNAIVENLLSMSRLESGMLRLKKSATDIFDLVSVVADALRRQSKDHPLSIRIDEEVSAVSMDLTLMVQVMTNILMNAARHTPAGTSIEIAVDREGAGVVITVSDDGPGVPETELPRLFERFFRGTRATTDGAGLGLSICKGIVEAHGGTISAYINRRGGLSIRIALPDSVVADAEGIVS